MPILPHKPWPSVVRSSYGLRRRTTRRISQVANDLQCNRHTVGRWRHRYLAQGLNGLQDAPRPGRPRRFSPSARLDVMAMATRKPARYHCAATRWSLDDLVAALAQRHPWTMSRSSIWRLLDDADLKPHRSVYWLNSHDPDFEAKAHAHLFLISPCASLL